ncbi:MAG: hypothetical protein IT385_06685 [Deltaproteobacteria bacterium]|nr:hypothetical protein [Deltaproteobacteria bacterium]
MVVGCDPAGGSSASTTDLAAPGMRVAALDAAPRTIPYGGYVDFDGEPVNAGNVGFNFALFPCATPGPAAGQCLPLWVAKGTWNDAASDWKQGWPAGAGTTIALPIFSGRFQVELGGAGQNPLPDPLESDEPELFLGIQIEGRALGTVQRLVTARRSVTSVAAAQALPNEDFVVHQDLVVTGRVVDPQGVQITVPSGAVIPFDLDACPPGWTEYAPAYGRFVRGVDRSGTSRDPDGERDVGSTQDDLLKSHTHQYTYMQSDNSVDGVDSATQYSGEHHNEQGQTGATGGAETRPKNVALLFCRKD